MSRMYAAQTAVLVASKFARTRTRQAARILKRGKLLRICQHAAYVALPLQLCRALLPSGDARASALQKLQALLATMESARQSASTSIAALVIVGGLLCAEAGGAAVAVPWAATEPSAVEQRVASSALASSSRGSPPGAEERSRGARQPGGGAWPGGLDAASAPGVDVAGAATQDDLLQVVRQLEATMNSAASTVTKGLGLSLPVVDPDAAAAAKQLVDETVALIEASWLDARGTGLDPVKWHELYDEAMAAPPRNAFEAHAVIRTLLARGTQDPYTRFLSPGEFKAMTSYDVTGVGLNLGTAEDFVRKTGLPLPPGREAERRSVFVIGVIKGTSAVVAGVRQGDEILRVNERDVTQLSPFEAAMLIAGPQASAEAVQPEAAVNIEVRHSDGAVEAMTVEREASPVASPVKWRLEQRGARRIGFIKLKAFNARAQPEVLSAVQALTRRGATELVLDLSDNRGGLVNEGIEIARMFLPDNSTIFITQGKDGSTPTRIERGAPVTDLPLTVIVNERTASSSEILSGALQDNCRAVLAGHTTYGKGLIQSVYELQDSAGLVVTVGKYLTPNGTDIDRSGIEPDFPALPSRRAADSAIAACRLRAAA